MSVLTGFAECSCPLNCVPGVCCFLLTVFAGLVSCLLAESLVFAPLECVALSGSFCNLRVALLFAP